VKVSFWVEVSRSRSDSSLRPPFGFRRFTAVLVVVMMPNVDPVAIRVNPLDVWRLCGYTRPTMNDATNTTETAEQAASAVGQTARQQRGLALAKGKKIKPIAGATYLVPSATGSGGYVVNALAGTCTCPDHEERRVKCKHLFAVEFSRTVETAPDGSTVVTESIKVTRKTYRQDWPKYNAAQCAEKASVQGLLHSLCEGIVTPPHEGRGPKPLPLSDLIYSMGFKVYTTVSGRRATTDMEASAEEGHMTKAPHYNSIFRGFERADLAPLLTALVEESAAPLAAVETSFAVDSTGFSTSTYRRWYDHKYGGEKKEHGWVKLHAAVGTVTNIMTAVRVTDSDSNDCPELPALVKTTRGRFDMKDVEADKAYLSRANLDAIEAVGAVPYIPFKSNSKGDGPAAWRRMWGLFMYKHEEFLRHYHQRSNVETAFSAIKRLLGGSLRSKVFAAQVNECLLKALMYNLTVLTHAMFELGIDEPTFTAPQLQEAA
jgi:transposase